MDWQVCRNLSGVISFWARSEQIRRPPFALIDPFVFHSPLSLSLCRRCIPFIGGCRCVWDVQLFLEDILNVSQTARLQIVVPSTVTKQMMPSEQQAHLFRLLRPFGRLISVDGGKDGVWEVDFLLSSSAVAARNCLQNMDFLSFVNGLEARDMESSAEKGPRALQLQFVSFSRFEDLKEWLKSPKFATAFFLFLGALLVILVQPFRLANVVQTLALPWKHEESVRELLSKENSALGWIDRGDVRAVLEGAFNRRPNPVLLLSGPKGVGKTTLIKVRHPSLSFPVQWIHVSIFIFIFLFVIVVVLFL